MSDIGQFLLEKATTFIVQVRMVRRRLLQQLMRHRANPINIAADVLELLPQLEKNLPSNISSMNARTIQTIAINESIQEVIKTILEAALIVLIVTTVLVPHSERTDPYRYYPTILIGVAMVPGDGLPSLEPDDTTGNGTAIGLVVDDDRGYLRTSTGISLESSSALRSSVP
ncbi:hypothetical protein O9929_00065 [Vibrio lentus]|nr:hypothetical protein [Vibrio lentus]